MKKNTTIAFTGDIGFDKYMEKKWEDEDLLAPEITEFLTSADHVVANVEGPLVDNTATLTQAAEMRLMHTIHPDAEKVLRDIHADIWNLCNNHIMDAGQDGLALTLQEAKKFGAKTIGVGMNMTEAARPLILDEAGGIGLLPWALSAAVNLPEKIKAAASAGVRWRSFAASFRKSRPNAAGVWL